jgi:flagellar basal body-associated protein FliL
VTERSRRSKKGMVLVIVIAVIMMMTIVVMGMLSRNVSRALTTEKQIKRIKAEVLAEGAFWRAYQDDGTPPVATFSVISDGETYTVSYTDPVDAGPGGTDSKKVTVTY